MAVPSSYTEETLADYMAAVLGQVATALGFTSPASYGEAVNDTLIAYGGSTVAGATDIAKLRALARVQAWRLAQANAAAHVSVSAEGTQMSQSDLHKAISENLRLAEVQAWPYDAIYQVKVSRVQYADSYQTVTAAED